MECYDYIIADLCLRSNVDLAALGLRGFRPFQSNGSVQIADCRFAILDEVGCNNNHITNEIYSSYMSETNTRGLLYKTRSGYLYSISKQEPNAESLIFNIEEDGWLITSNYDTAKFDLAMLRFGLWISFGLLLVNRNAVAVHSSVVTHDGRGVLFLGESGTGKSTHTCLWCENITNTHLLNDDSPIVRLVDDELRVYGSPWSGKTPCYKNESYPIAAFCRLSQAPENRIRRLSTIATIGALLPSTPPQFADDVGLQDLVLAMLSGIIERVPAYHLECLPNSDAAELSHKTIFGYETSVG